MIREFETNPEIGWHDDGRSYCKWLGKQSIDLSWVASASPYFPASTSICLCGSGHAFQINIAYEEFIKLWLEAKGQVAA